MINFHVFTHPCNRCPENKTLPAQLPLTKGSHRCVHRGSYEKAPRSFLPPPLSLEPQQEGGSHAAQVC